MMRALGVALVGAGVLTAVLGLGLRSAHMGGLVATGIIAVLWSRQLVRLGSGIAERMDGWLAVVWLLLIGFAVAVGLRLAMRRGLLTTPPDRWTSLLNRAGALMLVATVLLGVLNGRFSALAPDVSQGVELSAAPRATTSATDLSSDIYVILLDGYPRADVLEHVFQIDNEPFLDQLRERGFESSGRSHSDYLWTHLTLPSMLNMAYIENVPQAMDVAEGRAPRQPTLRRSVADSEVMEEARRAGYTTIAVHSGFEEIALRQADVFLDGGQLNEFELKLLLSTWASELLATAAPDLASAQHRDRIRHALGSLAEVAGADRTGPKFVFSHVPAPHAPIVFGSDASPVTTRFDEKFYADSPLERGQDPDEFAEQYRAQLPSLNDLIVRAVDDIIARSSRPPVILLMADHGSASRIDWTATPVSDADPAELLERTGVLFAALTPGRERVFPDDISPVNVFRYLFDAYLGTDYGPAPLPQDGGHIPPVDATVLGD